MKSVKKIKTKYYTKKILKYLLLTGAVYIAASSPYFSLYLTKKVFGAKGKVPPRKISSTFYYLRNKGLLELKKEGHDVRISLTAEGKKRAGKYQIDELKIEKPKKWDGKWRVIIFDIPNSKNIIRNIFRRKLKEFNFYPLQKSIWAYPYPCKEEVGFIRKFLGASEKEIQVLEVSKMEKDNFLRKIFKI